MVGASGALYGVLVGFAMLFPNAQLMLLFPPIPVKAKILVPILILADLFFEFYEDDLYSFFHEKEEKLMDFNIALIKKILSLLNADVKINLAKNEINESLELLNAKEKKVFKTPVYRQVFDSKYGFISNLSILDLIFNVGPESLDYLSKISL